ncbi:cyd operon YbgE family protein [Vibrio sp. WJH972]
MNSNPAAILMKPIDSLIVRLFIMALGLFHAGLLMWEPTQYANSIGGFSLLKVTLLIWSMCSSMVVGIGFHPYRSVFKLMFSPYFSLLILLGFTGLVLL